MRTTLLRSVLAFFSRRSAAEVPRSHRRRRNPSGRRSWNSLGRRISAEQLELRWTPSATPVAVTGLPVSGFEGAPLVNVPVATFTAGDGSTPANQFTAVINWGDGTVTTGTIGESGTTYVVVGSHTYADENNYTVAVGIVESSVPQAFSFNHANIQPLLPNGTQGTVDQRVVHEVLTTLMQRPVSMDEINYWTTQYDLHQRDTLNLSQMIIEDTPPYEYRRGEINSAYQTYLHRAADPSGEAYFLSLVNNSQGVPSGPGTERRTAAILISSQEFFVEQGGGTNAGFITAVFEDALKRAPDPGALAFYGQELAAGMTHVEFATQILNSIEAETRTINNLYERYLGRPVDPGGLQAFLFNNSQGYGTETNTETILTTPEFYNKAIGAF